MGELNNELFIVAAQDPERRVTVDISRYFGDDEDDEVDIAISECAPHGYWLDGTETCVDGIQARRIRDFLTVWQSAERTPGGFASVLELRAYPDEALCLTGCKHPTDPHQDKVNISISALIMINPTRWVVMAEVDLSAADAEQLRQFLMAWYPLEPAANPAQLALELPPCV